MPIELLGAFTTYLLQDAELRALVGEQLSARHRFAMKSSVGGWTTPSRAIQLRYDTGAIVDDAGMERARLDARCYGATPQEAAEVYARLRSIVNRFIRTTVNTGNGVALLYQLYQDTSPRSDRDLEIHVDFVQCFLRASCHQDPIV